MELGSDNGFHRAGRLTLAGRYGTSTVVSHSAWAVGGGGSHHRVVRGEIVIGRKMSCFPTSIRPVLCDASGLTRLIKFLSSRNGRGAEIISISSVLLSRILASRSAST